MMLFDALEEIHLFLRGTHLPLSLLCERETCLQTSAVSSEVSPGVCYQVFSGIFHLKDPKPFFFFKKKTNSPDPPLQRCLCLRQPPCLNQTWPKTCDPRKSWLSIFSSHFLIFTWVPPPTWCFPGLPTAPCQKELWGDPRQAGLPSAPGRCSWW